jgi:tRNA (guanine-N7-)-methyltransferase
MQKRRLSSEEGHQNAIARRQERIENMKNTLEQEIFSNPNFNNKPILLEVGCGHGHWLTSFSELNPEYLCIGIDIINKRIQKCISKKERAELQSTFYYKIELTEFLEAFSTLNKTVDRIVFLFPDPWPKKRHFKHRMIQRDLMSKLRQITSNVTRFCFRTDYEGYFDWTKEIIQEHKDWDLVDGLGEWPHESPTFFQEMMGKYQSLIARPVE